MCAESGSALVREGPRVASLDVLDDLGNKVAEAANEAGPGRATYLHCDISSRTGVDTAFERGARAMGGIDGLVNAAGIERHIDPQDITDDDWDVLMALNVPGTFLTNQAAFRYMREQGGRILNFGSDAGLLAYPSAAPYSASKRADTGRASCRERGGQDG